MTRSASALQVRLNIDLEPRDGNHTDLNVAPTPAPSATHTWRTKPFPFEDEL